MKKKSPHLNWETIASKKGEDLIIFNVRYDTVVNPMNDKQMKAVVLESNDAANIIALTRNEQVLLARQYRFGTQTISLEIPGGFVDEGEEHQQAAQRELEEETGFTADEWEYLGFSYANPVFMNSKVHHWVARNAERTNDLSLDRGEAIELLIYPLSEVKTMLNDGIIAHPHTIAAFARFFKF